MVVTTPGRDHHGDICCRPDFATSPHCDLRLVFLPPGPQFPVSLAGAPVCEFRQKCTESPLANLLTKLFPLLPADVNTVLTKDVSAREGSE